MADFPPNLDDGEFWLPSDIFVNEAAPTTHHLSCMDYYLARHFTALSFIQNHPSRNLHKKLPRKPTPISQRFKPVVDRDGAVNYLPLGNFGVNGGAELGQSLRGYGTRTVVTRSDSFYELQLQPQVDISLETGARVLQKQQTRLQNRVYPFQGSGLGFGNGGGNGGGGGVRESAGTGVFHPRIVNPTTSMDVKKKQVAGMRSRQELQVTQQRNSSIRRVGVSKPEDCYYHLPPEMGLPHDWSY